MCIALGRRNRFRDDFYRLPEPDGSVAFRLPESLSMSFGPCRPLLLLLCCLPAACTSLPSPAEVLATGWRSPEQCWRTFQVAVRADEPGLEYRCLSRQLCQERGLSQFNWRELRAELWGQFGSRYAVEQATPTGPARIQGERAELEIEALGKKLRLGFVREDYAELWAGETRLYDEADRWSARTGTQSNGGQRWFYAQLPIPEALDSAGLSELRVGREWKLDEISEPYDS